MELYAVIGNPVRHSRSPQIHLHFAKLTRQLLQYEMIEAPVDGFEKAAKRFIGQGGCGLNVTIPFKLAAYALASENTLRAKLAGAVNTLSFRAGVIYGDNTDGIGLLNDIIKNRGFSIARKRVALLGAGGAARGALFPLLQEKPAQLWIINRTAEKARTLAAQFSEYGNISVGYPKQHFDLVINATSASLQKEMPWVDETWFDKNTLAYDMMYGQNALPPFLAFAKKHKAQLANGLGMLVEQAAESFYVWRGIHPPTAPVLEKLRGLYPQTV